MLDNKTTIKPCVVGGTLLNVLVTFDFSHLFSSALLAVLGTVISYFVSKGLKALFEKELNP